jgi:hypothetical protein
MRPHVDLRRGGLEALNEVDGLVFKTTRDPSCMAMGRLRRQLIR